MALPMLFTACSQDEYLDDLKAGGMQAPEVKGYDITFMPTLGADANTRAEWTGRKLTWDANDKISVYWLGAEDLANSLYGDFNSIFKTADGNAFTSESMVFVGKNIAVYPADMAFTKPGTIGLEVKAEQKAGDILNIPYISNQLNIIDTDGKYELSGQKPGYNEGLHAPLKMAANVLNLTVDLGTSDDELISKYGFKVESVVLQTYDPTVADSLAYGSKIFTTKAELVAQDQTPYDSCQVTYKATENATTLTKVNGIDKQVWLKSVTKSEYLKSTAITANTDGTYTAQFVVLPSDVNLSGANVQIVVNTNCGHIIIRSKQGTKKVDNVDVPYVSKGAISGGTDLATDKAYADTTILKTFERLLTSTVIPANYKYTSNFKGEESGIVFNRSVKASMADAILDGSYVYSDADIKNYVQIRAAMSNTQPMSLRMALEESNKTKTFPALTAATLALIDAQNAAAAAAQPAQGQITLVPQTGVENILIADGGNVYDIKSLAGDANLILAAEKTWAMDDTLALDANIKSIINNGTLTVAGTAKNNAQSVLAETIVNNASLKIAGNNKLQVANNLINVTDAEEEINGTIDIASGQNLVFTADQATGIAGTINVAQGGFMTIAANKKVSSSATINNYGLVSAENGDGGLTNTGVINVLRDGAITYVQDNKEGTINLKSRNNEAVVKTNKGKIVYNYASATDGATFVRKAADKFTYVVFGEGNSAITLAKTTEKFDGVNALSIEDLSFKFTDETNLTTNGLHFETLEVAAGAHLQVLSGNTVSVHNLINNGVITVGGTITYLNNHIKAANATVYSVGEGAIVYGAALAATAAAVEDAIEAGQDVILTQSLGLSAAQLAAAENITISGATQNVALTISGSTSLNVFDGAVNLKNLTLTTTKVNDSNYSGGYGEFVLFKGAVSLEDVTLNIIPVVAGNATFDGVTFNGSEWDSDDYAMWIAPLGQTVTVKDCAVTCDRGFKVDNTLMTTYSLTGIESQVALNVSGTSFDTDAKAAVLARGKVKVVWGAGNSIAQVAEDDENAVWVDEDYAANTANVVVSGCTKIDEP